MVITVFLWQLHVMLGEQRRLRGTPIETHSNKRPSEDECCILRAFHRL